VCGNIQSFSSRDEFTADARVRTDVDRLTSTTVAGVEAKKTRHVKLCTVRRYANALVMEILWRNISAQKFPRFGKVWHCIDRCPVATPEIVT